jgi:lysophospholipase L1-like esterase
MRYLALGDSYTAGEGVGADGTFPARIRVGAARGRPLHAPPLHAPPLHAPDVIARTGWTTGDLLAEVRARAPAGPYDLVTLCIGVNNQYRGEPIERYRAEFRELLTLAIGLGGNFPSHVVVLSIPDWGVTPFAEGRDRAQIAGAIDAFNAVAETAVRRLGAGWVNVTDDSRSHPLDLVADGLHPSAAAYQRWADLVLGAIHL